MTVQEVIDELNKVEDKSKECEYWNVDYPFNSHEWVPITDIDEVDGKIIIA